MEALDYSYDALARRISEASEGALIVAGAMCLYRIGPVLEGGGLNLDLTALERIEEWGSNQFRETLKSVLVVLINGLPDELDENELGAGAALQNMAAAAVRGFFNEDSAVGDWADLASTVSLDISQEFDAFISEADSEVGPKFFPAGTFPDLTPLEAAEVVDQVDVLVNLSAGKPEGLRRILEISKNGKERTREILEAMSAVED